MRVANEILIPELARLLAEGKQVRFTPSGVSMRPFIEGDKDSVVLAPITKALRIGDIVLAKVETAYVLHRIVRIEGTEYVLQGDGNLTGEERCAREEIIGRVAAIENANGKRKLLTRGRIWYFLKPVRRYLLKIYRHLFI